jgi:hypothetical protein
MIQGHDETQIARDLGAQTSFESGREALTLALDELAIAGLIQSDGKAVAPALEGTTRRQMVGRLMAASAALLVPSVLTLTPNAADAQSVNRPLGSTCDCNSQCSSGCCATNSSNGPGATPSCSQGHCSPLNCGNGIGCGDTVCT